MKIQGLLWSTIIASSLFVSPAGFAAEEASRGVAAATKPEAPTFDVSFPGGTLTEFVAHVDKAIEAHVRFPAKPNLLFPPEAASIKIPRIELRSVNLQTLMSAVSLLVQSEYIWQASGSSTFVLVPRRDIRSTQVFFVGHLLRKFKIEDITTAIETVWQMGSKTKPELKYHQDTQLLIVRADKDQLEMATNVLNQLRDALAFDSPAEKTQNAAKPTQPKR